MTQEELERARKQAAAEVIYNLESWASGQDWAMADALCKGLYVSIGYCLREALMNKLDQLRDELGIWGISEKQSRAMSDLDMMLMSTRPHKEDAEPGEEG